MKRYKTSCNYADFVNDSGFVCDLSVFPDSIVEADSVLSLKEMLERSQKGISALGGLVGYRDGSFDIDGDSRVADELDIEPLHLESTVDIVDVLERQEQITERLASVKRKVSRERKRSEDLSEPVSEVPSETPQKVSDIPEN